MFEVLYQAYLTALVSSVAVVVASDLVGDTAVPPEQLTNVRADGAAAVGVLVAVLVFLACRSGGQGGPLALERADVMHVLLAPVDRARVLRRPAVARLRSRAALGAALGAGLGVVVSHRLPGAAPEWIASGALAGMTAGTLATGVAMVVSGRRISRPVATVIGLAVLTWSGTDLALGTRTSPFAAIGELALWPVRSPPAGSISALAAAAVIAGWGVARIGGLSLEAAERRATLVGQLRFAATLRDLRTIVVLRRQLAQERPRRSPWVRLRSGSTAGGAVWKRDWHGILRWPSGRILRALILAAAAGLAVRGMWAGTTALIIAAGVALWVAALDAVEGLAQDQDHPDLAGRLPVRDGWLLVRHLPAAVAVMLLVVPAAIIASLPDAEPSLALGLGAVIAIPAAACAVASAAVSTARAVDFEGVLIATLAPEFAGFRLVLRESLPPALATAGLLPLVAAREAAQTGGRPVLMASATAVALILPLAGSVWWLSSRRLT